MTETPVKMTWHKWPSRPHWEVSTLRLESDGDGLWLGSVGGTPITRPPGREPVVASADSVILCTRDRPWVARWYRSPGETGRAARYCCYVDITTPPVIAEDQVTVVDLDLDVTVSWDGRMEVLDEDEFIAHAGAYGYPDSIQSQARAACLEVQSLLASNAGPFDGRHAVMLRRLALDSAFR